MSIMTNDVRLFFRFYLFSLSQNELKYFKGKLIDSIPADE